MYRNLPIKAANRSKGQSTWLLNFGGLWSLDLPLISENKDCDDLEKGKVYQILLDDTAGQEGYLRVVDESTEDYLYPESYFVLLDLPKKAQDALLMRA